MTQTCVATGCGRPCKGNYCPEHKPATATLDNRRRNRKTVSHGVKRAHWQQIRKERLALTGGYCELRHDGCTAKATSVHCTRADGNHDLATIDEAQTACEHCHGVEDGGRAHAGRRAA